MTKIDDNLPLEVLSLFAEALGFRLSFDHAPDADEWTASAGHGVTYVQYVGTRKSMCAFLTGYGAMRLQTAQIINEVEMANNALISAMRSKIQR